MADGYINELDELEAKVTKLSNELSNYVDKCNILSMRLMKSDNALED